MKNLKVLVIALTTISMLALIPVSADAHRRGWGGRGFFYGSALGLGVGLAWPGPWWYARPYPYYAYPGYYNPGYYNQSVVVVPQTAPVIQSVAPIVPPPQYWYFCESTSTYYPYVQSCDREWRMVPITPPNK
jgi:hypothetical protein